MLRRVVICWALLALVGAYECPDGGRCEEGQTCCNDPANGYECCPFDQVDMSYHLPLTCPDGSTCCKTKDGDWACCPLPEAVCCEDFIHCCPNGQKCNLAAGTCDDGKSSVPWMEKVPAVSKQGAQVQDVPCNSTVSCRDGSTCCKNKDGDWACCPLPEAVCCDDHEHCCPSGCTCDLTTATVVCQCASGSTPTKQKTPAFLTSTVQTEGEKMEMKTPETEEDKENKEEEGRIQCDAHTSCPQYSTCCLMTSTHKWGCCPLPEVSIFKRSHHPSCPSMQMTHQLPGRAVCCADGSHCCPAHYKCNEEKTTCTKGDVVIPWYTKLPASSSVQTDASSVQCKDLSHCPEHNTCCQLFTGEWGCCPLQNAVCCSNMKHCCPSGYTCNEDGTCAQNTWLRWHSWYMFLSNKKRALLL
uniref:Granulins domain-containing protein n=1 Tax=Monopterus albus TaxID=43700 RepID=A0A3Q3ISK3_MONAL